MGIRKHGKNKKHDRYKIEHRRERNKKRKADKREKKYAKNQIRREKQNETV